jgi:hypothetical protein
MATNTFFDLEALSKELEEKLNGTDFENIISYGLNNIYPHTQYAFRLLSDTDAYEAGERVGNNVVRYINGEMNVINNQTEGIGSTTYNAVIETKVEFLVSLIGPEKKNKALINAIRSLVNNTLQYAETSSVDYNGMTYTHITEYSILNSGIREQRDIVGDSVSLTIFITHSYVALGVASSAIRVSVFNPFTNEYELVAYDNEGAARKTITEQNTYAKSVNTDNTNIDPSYTVPNESCALPSSTLYTLSFDMYSRLFIMDYYIDRYVYDRLTDVIKVKVSRPNPEYYLVLATGLLPGQINPITTPKIKETKYNMIIETAGHNAKLGALATSSVTLVSVAPLAEPEA